MTEDEFPLPEKTDKLFVASEDNYRDNAMLNFSNHPLFSYSEGYKLGAKKLLEAHDGEAYHANMLVYPIVFLYRQFIELRLKELILGLNHSLGNPDDFPDGHNLKELWKQYRTLIEKFGPTERPEKEMLDNAEKLIFEFSDTDPDSFAFRYPVHKKNRNRKPTVSINILDLTNFGIVMKKIENFLDTQSDVVFYLMDMTDEMKSAYEGYY